MQRGQKVVKRLAKFKVEAPADRQNRSCRKGMVVGGPDAADSFGISALIARTSVGQCSDASGSGSAQARRESWSAPPAGIPTGSAAILLPVPPPLGHARAPTIRPGRLGGEAFPP
jgi:hypothetical protein